MNSNGRRYLALVWSAAFALSLTGAASPEQSDAGLTALFFRYYSAIEKGRWPDAFRLLHERLKIATQVRTPEDLARRSHQSQKELIEAFETFDHLEVDKTAIDLSSLQARVTEAGGGHVAGELRYDFVVFPKGPGRPLMYRVIMNVGLEQGLIIRMTQQSMARIDPGRAGETL